MWQSCRADTCVHAPSALRRPQSAQSVAGLCSLPCESTLHELLKSLSFSHSAARWHNLCVI